MSGSGKVIAVDSLSLPAGHRRHRAWRTWLRYITGGIWLALVLYYGARSLWTAREGPAHLVVYAFSTQEELFTQSILPAFEESWEAETGRELTIDAVFGPSATLAGQIVLGAPADVALFSNAHHVTYLRLGKMIDQDTQPHVIGGTPMVIVTRPGNPLELHDFSDLARPGLRLIHASPRSSGGGEWAVLAEYGSAQRATDDDAAAAAQLRATWSNVRLLAPSARTAITLFELGDGDALVTYEQDALLAQERGVPLEIVIPPRTIIAQPVAVIVDHNVTRAEQPAAEAFVRYLLSAEGQQQFAHYYQRPVNGVGAPFPPLQDPFTVEDLGGWTQAHQQIVKALWQDEIEPRLDLETTPQLLGPGTPAADNGRDR
ncbi:MAG TPA: extracellular solute-binding protein [Candidatus Sulfomarinibacteraceae bacterium]|nr:extracellular solute-binding protein [Candidatus Sulfomarinibacteraceae bacterium]